MSVLAQYAIETRGAADRAAVFEKGTGLVIAVADGHGGAPQAVVDAARSDEARDWTALILGLDDALCAARVGPTAAVVLVLDGKAVTGASVGDLGAWWIDAHAIEKLTEKQLAAPLIGTGNTSPFAFRMRGLEHGTLIVATAALFTADANTIAQIARTNDAAKAAHALAELVSPRDVAVVVVSRS